MLRVFKLSLLFTLITFLIGVLVEYFTDKNFTTTFFIKKAISNIIAGIFYFFIMYCFSKKSK